MPASFALALDTQTLAPDILAALTSAVGEGTIATEQSEIAPHLVETRGLYQGAAGALLTPRTVDEVQAILRVCSAHRVRLVVHGGNTGLVGGGVPQGGIVLSLRKLNRIRAVDPVDSTITVEAGVVLRHVQDAAEAAGRLFPLSLGSEGSCTIGGNLASNAGGTAVLRYGNARDLCLGLEVVLADGRRIDGLSRLRKDNAGYDLKQLFIGSEGTLGIITAAVLKLFPRPKSRATAWVGARSPAAVLDLFDRLRNEAGESLSTFEIMPAFALAMVLRHCPGTLAPLAGQHGWHALIELTSPRNEAGLDRTLEGALGGALDAGIIEDAMIAASGAQAAALWRIREELSDAQRPEGGSIKHDVSVPVSRTACFIDEATAACEAAMAGIRVCAFGHIGDGNIHFNLSQPVGMDKAAFLAEWSRFNRIVHDIVVAYGGSIAAEHGVGLVKRDELARYKDPVALSLMRALKTTLDPLGILNPGKVV